MQEPRAERPRPALRPLLALNRLGERLTPTRPRSVAERRESSARSPLRMPVVTRRPREPLTVVDREVPVPGGSVPVRCYRPAGRDDERLPTLLFAHGGCYWLGDIEAYDPICRTYAAGAACQVVSVGYRRAPEHPYPTALEDCFAALRWVADRADELAVDLDRLAVGGISAGGGLAAAVALRARDAGGPRLCLQVLEIPAVDAAMTGASLEEFGQGYSLSRAEMAEGWDFYVPDLDQRDDPYASPLAAADLTGLPPAYVLTCGCDPLRDEGEAYARRLREAGVPVETFRATGHVHGSIYLTRLLPSARATVGRTVAVLRRAYGT